VLEGCDISSDSGVGVGVEGATLQLLDSAIHDCERHGVTAFGGFEGAGAWTGAGQRALMRGKGQEYRVGGAAGALTSCPCLPGISRSHRPSQALPCSAWALLGGCPALLRRARPPQSPLAQARPGAAL
jgi:hypothetical protein